MNKIDLLDNVTEIFRNNGKKMIELQKEKSDLIVQFKNRQIEYQMNLFGITLTDFIDQIKEKMKNEHDIEQLLSYTMVLTSILESLIQHLHELEKAYNSETE